MKKIIVASLTAILLTGCATAPKGSSWWCADFNKYEKNYADFPVGQIRIGQSKEDMSFLVGVPYDVVEAGEGYEVVAIQKWKSVPGPDYIEQILYIKLVNGKVSNWKVTNDVVEIVPRTW